MTTQGTLALPEPPNADAKRAADGNSPGGNPASAAAGKEPRWLGLVTTHRRLFDAAQDGWMRPLPRSGFLLGCESFEPERASGGRRAIPVRLAFDASKLPFPDMRKELERAVSGEDGERGPRVVHWRAPLPLYAVDRMEVASAERKTRVLAMAGQFSNVCLPGTDVDVSGFADRLPEDDRPAAPETRSLELPETLNAVQGAMAMAVWAVPHVERWIEVLRRALGGDADGAAKGAGELDARWLRFPWLVRDVSGAAPDGADEQERLWRAALVCMRWQAGENASPDALAARIARTACAGGANRTAAAWLDRTRRIVAAEETIACDGWRRGGAGLAIRLALLRPDPARFKSWNRDLPGLPPGVWWAAATLCGWSRGYRVLDKKFRGDSARQEFIATRALDASWRGGSSAVLPRSQRSPLGLVREDGCYALTWSGRPVVRKQWQSRARWCEADFADADADRAARELAARSGWPCIERRLSLPEGKVETVGGGRLSVRGGALFVKGEKSLRLGEGAELDERLDADEFRRRLAAEAGVVPDPPKTLRRRPAAEAGNVPEPSKTSRPPPAGEPRGLIYRKDFITEDEEAGLVERIDAAEWSTELKRRVQHYGWRYDYGRRRVDASMRLGELPDWARELGWRLVDEGLVEELPDQVIVNEYLGRQGIGKHVDAEECFAEHIATVSLLETWGMVFRRPGGKERVEKPLERRSVAVLTGEARYDWTHEIPQRKTEWRMNSEGKRKRVDRLRRISLTFRTTRLPRGG